MEESLHQKLECHGTLVGRQINPTCWRLPWALFPKVKAFDETLRIVYLLQLFKCGVYNSRVAHAYYTLLFVIAPTKKIRLTCCAQFWKLTYFCHWLNSGCSQQG